MKIARSVLLIEGGGGSGAGTILPIQRGSGKVISDITNQGTGYLTTPNVVPVIQLKLRELQINCF